MMQRRPLVFLLLVTIVSCAVAATPADERTVRNVETFARLYGYVRFFHPSDEASSVDWDRFAIHGVRAVRDAADQEELRRVLEELFLPIAPTLQIYESDAAEPPPSAALMPPDTAGLDLVVWQHMGFGFAGPRDVFNSVRLNRENPVPRMGFGRAFTTVDAVPYRGKMLRLVGAARADIEAGAGQVQLWMRIDRTDNMLGFFDNMHDRPITSSHWKSYEISGPVADDAVRVAFGGFLMGNGAGFLDDFRLYVGDGQGPWEPVEIANGGFESDEAGSLPFEWLTNGDGYVFSVVDDSPFEGEKSVRISSKPLAMEAPLFPDHARPGEIVTRTIGSGLSVQLPLALYSREGRTLGSTGDGPIDTLLAALGEIGLDTLTADDVDLRLADVVIAWNIFQHFYPYFDVVATDWDAVLPATLAAAVDDADARVFLRTLRRMVAQLDDGHGGVYHPMERSNAWLPVLPAWVEDRLVVVSAPSTTSVESGDAIISIDGIPAAEYLDEAERYVSGTPQLKRHTVLERFGIGPRGTDVQLVLERDGKHLEVTIPRSNTDFMREVRPEMVEEIEDGIFYVDLDRADMAFIHEHIEKLAAARGVIFDLRGYPNRNHEVLSHLTDQPILTARWQVPLIIYPDRENLAGYDTTGRWIIEPTQPRIRGKVAFLTDGRAMSYAETVMGIVEHYRLGEIVGSTTAGTNGNIAPFLLPGGFRVAFTGMRVLKHDRSQHHLVGIQPTVPVERTIEGVRAGRDEVLERALEIVREVGR